MMQGSKSWNCQKGGKKGKTKVKISECGERGNVVGWGDRGRAIRQGRIETDDPPLKGKEE